MPTDELWIVTAGHKYEGSSIRACFLNRELAEELIHDLWSKKVSSMIGFPGGITVRSRSFDNETIVWVDHDYFSAMKHSILNTRLTGQAEDTDPAISD